jgi:putative nucleotidyltransferase-like protein
MQRRDTGGSVGEMLMQACRMDGADRLGALRAGRLAEPATAQLYTGLAARHGVLGLALATLERSACWPTLAPEVQQGLGRTLKQLRMRATVLQLERDHVVATLLKHGVRAVVLKGAGLASTAYAEPVEREYGDLDLLVAPAEIDAAISALESRGYANPFSDESMEGYRRHHFHVHLRRPGERIVELHWAVTQQLEPFQLDAAAFLERSVQAGALRVPRAEHALLHMLVESVRGDFNRIKGLVDIDRIIGTAAAMDWSYLVASARTAHLLPALSLALETSRQLLGTQVPDAVLREAQPSRATRLHLALLRPSDLIMRQRTLARASSADLLRMWLLSGRSRAAWLMSLLTPAADHPLQWMWDDPNVPRTVRSTFVQRAARVGKLLAEQAGAYAVGTVTLLRGKA